MEVADPRWATLGAQAGWWSHDNLRDRWTSAAACWRGAMMTTLDRHSTASKPRARVPGTRADPADHGRRGAAVRTRSRRHIEPAKTTRAAAPIPFAMKRPGLTPKACACVQSKRHEGNNGPASIHSNRRLFVDSRSRTSCGRAVSLRTTTPTSALLINRVLAAVPVCTPHRRETSARSPGALTKTVCESPGETRRSLHAAADQRASIPSTPTEQATAMAANLPALSNHDWIRAHRVTANASPR